MLTYSAFYSVKFTVRQLAAGHAGFKTTPATCTHLPTALRQDTVFRSCKICTGCGFSYVLWLSKEKKCLISPPSIVFYLDRGGVSFGIGKVLYQFPF